MVTRSAVELLKQKNRVNVFYPLCFFSSTDFTPDVMGRPETEGEHNGNNKGSGVAIHWFRHGLRLHDNPALLEAIRDMKELYCVFIFDGKVAGQSNIVKSGSAISKIWIWNLESMKSGF